MAVLTNLDNEIFAQKALEGFVATLIPLGSFSNNYSAEAYEKGQNVLVPLVGSLTATTFGGAYNISGGSQTVITVPINRHKHVPVGQDDLTAASSSRANLEVYGYQAGAALGLAVFQDIWTLVTTGNFALATQVAVGGFGIAQIRAGRLLLHRAKVPMVGRNMILDVDPFDNLLGISNFLQANLAGTDAALREGQIGRVLGMMTYETNALPGTNSVMGLIGHASAMATAMRYLQPQKPEAYLEARAITDATTGMTFGYRRHYDPNTGNEFINLEANYGFAVGLTNGARILSRAD